MKHRGKRRDNGEWVYGSILHNKERAYIIDGIVEVNDEYINIETWNEVIPETVGWATGLKDKDGNDIYYCNTKGYTDKVRYQNPSVSSALDGKTGTVEYWDGVHYFRFDNIKYSFERFPSRILVEGNECLTVIEIGTIHD